MIFEALTDMIEIGMKETKRCFVAVNRLFWNFYKAGGNGMLNYEEELAKFQPSLEIDQAEEAIMNNDLTDLSDLLEQIVTGKKERR